MILTSQKSAISELQNCADSGRRSILLAGPAGCGKTYLSKQFANMLKIPDFQMVKSAVTDIRTVIGECYNTQNPIVVCIENLDEGVGAAAATLLKFLEEPLPHVYIVVTCRNVDWIPDTIISRSFLIPVAPPINSDLELYAKEKNVSRYSVLESRPIWRSVHSFPDIDQIFELTTDEVMYIESLYELVKSRKSIQATINGMRYFPEGKKPVPIDLVLSYLVSLGDAKISKYGYSCIKDLNIGRMGASAVLAKFLFDVRYGE
jgi:DNA polymerase III delta prime subunit